MRGHILLLTSTFIAALALAATNAGGAEIKTVPEKMHAQQPVPVWVADGATVYLVRVSVDNSGLGEDTSGVQWCFMNSPALPFVDVSLPTYNDFFQNYSMFFELIAPPGQLSGRLIAALGTGPIDHVGNLATYRFTVPVGFTVGQYSFDLSDTGLLNGNIEGQPHTISNDPVWITPLNPADFNYPPEITRDGYIDGADFQFLAAHMSGPGYSSPADIDGDGDTDMGDLARFQRCYTGTNPVAAATCGG